MKPSRGAANRRRELVDTGSNRLRGHLDDLGPSEASPTPPIGGNRQDALQCRELRARLRRNLPLKMSGSWKLPRWRRRSRWCHRRSAPGRRHHSRPLRIRLGRIIRDFRRKIAGNAEPEHRMKTTPNKRSHLLVTQEDHLTPVSSWAFTASALSASTSSRQRRTLSCVILRSKSVICSRNRKPSLARRIMSFSSVR